MNAVICDFGLAKMLKENNTEAASAAQGMVKGMKEVQAVGISYRYAAPEAFNRMYHRSSKVEEGRPVGTPSYVFCESINTQPPLHVDVFAFGIMCWEMYTGVPAFKGLMYWQFFDTVVSLVASPAEQQLLLTAI